MISIRFEAADLAGIRTALRAFLSDGDNAVAAPPEPAPWQTEAARSGDAPPEPVKRTRRTKAEMEAARAVEAEKTAATNAEHAAVEQAAQATTKPPAPAPAAEAPPPEPSTFADAKAALTRVVETNGLGVEAATGLLKRFNVARLSQLEEGQWTGFVLACETAVKGAAA